MNENIKHFPNLLIISVNAWSDSISSGNTISNHFGGWDPNNVANVFLRKEKIDNTCCSRYFRITESDILKSIQSGLGLGDEISLEENNKEIGKKNKKYQGSFIEKIKRIRPTSVLLLRELLWLFGFQKKDKLDAFITSFNPEIIHMHNSSLIYAHRILHHCINNSNSKVIVFFGDENYSYKNFWPLYRLNQFILRGWIKKTVKISDINYGATPELCKYYSNIFAKEFKVLYKGASIHHPDRKTHELPIKIIYAGNILWDRWRTLSLIAKAIENISDNVQKFSLEIYTHSTLSKEIRTALNTKNSTIKGAVPFEEVVKILSEADLVLHVEGFSKKYSDITKYSFSTKIVDCIQSGNCIMAVGPKTQASINFLINTDAAIIAHDFEEICLQLKSITSSLKILDEMPIRMFQIAKDNFDISKIREGIYKDIVGLL